MNFCTIEPLSTVSGRRLCSSGGAGNCRGAHRAIRVHPAVRRGAHLREHHGIDSGIRPRLFRGVSGARNLRGKAERATQQRVQHCAKERGSKTIVEQIVCKPVSQIQEHGAGDIVEVAHTVPQERANQRAVEEMGVIPVLHCTAKRRTLVVVTERIVERSGDTLVPQIGEGIVKVIRLIQQEHISERFGWCVRGCNLDACASVSNSRKSRRNRRRTLGQKVCDRVTTKHL